MLLRIFAAAAIGGGDLHILANREREEWLGHLKGAIDAEVHKFVRRQSADRALVEENLPVIGPVEAGDDIDAGGLAGAVGSDQPENLSRHEAEADAIQGAESRETLDDLVDAKQRSARRL